VKRRLAHLDVPLLATDVRSSGSQNNLSANSTNTVLRGSRFAGGSSLVSDSYEKTSSSERVTRPMDRYVPRTSLLPDAQRLSKNQLLTGSKTSMTSFSSANVSDLEQSTNTS
jgi:hypothetical protein